MNRNFYLPGTPLCLSLPVIGWLFAGIRAGFCFKGNSSTQSNPTTTSNIQDTRAAATEGSLAATSGGSIHVENVDKDVIAGLGETTAEISGTAIKEVASVAKTTVQENADVSKSAISGAGGQLRDALSFGEDLAQAAINAAKESQASANDLIRATNEQFTSKLVANQGPAATDVAETTTKYVTLAAAILGILIIFRPSKT